ncbi:MAG TPA: prolipoprotein diacylglyceryl transferase family protein [Gemmatimonadaceae bacterium]|nr:prolipoprotein diacylglyceryl transferase family protein [Gemmatimonadaceae bacterium]
MKRILFHVFGRPIHSYPAMLYIGLVFGVTASNIAAHVAAVDALGVYIATLLLLVPSLAGARLLYVAVHWNRYKNDRSRIWDLKEGGMAQYGGLLLNVPLSVPLLAALDLPFGIFWDISSFTMLVGMIFTRFGCLLNGCCSGHPSSSWIAVNLPDHEGVWEKRIPTQLLEAGWATIVLVAAIAIWGSLPFDGALFLFVASAYAAGRLVLESTRDLRRVGRRFTVHHAISLLIIGLSIAAITSRALM